ncbi:MAG: TRAP transporter large permease subunit, partial [Hydrogenophaga sp.]|nr:TRAP transporter large permease subunit [Hydrogenophaga sp.]
MNEMFVAVVLAVTLFALLGSGVWIGLTLAGVAWIGMELFSARSAGDAMAVTIWGSGSSWTLTALPLFIWMGEILFRTKLSQSMFKGLAPWVNSLPGGLLHTNILGSTIFAAVSGSSAATCATIGKMTIPELTARGYPPERVIGSLGGASTLGLLIPPSIIMIVYGVAAEVSIAKMFVAGVIPGLLLGAIFSGYLIIWALMNPDKVPKADAGMRFVDKLRASSELMPVVFLIGGVIGSIYSGFATATEAAALGVVGALMLSAYQKSLTWNNFKDALLGATRLYCMMALILAGAMMALILAGAAFLTLSMGYLGLPRHLAEWVGSLGLSPGFLLVALALFFILLGCFLDGISMIVLTMGVLIPTVQAAGIDLIWFGIFVVIVVEMAQITPPVGFNLFVLQGMTG